jgi:hypothetical protein
MRKKKVSRILILIGCTLLLLQLFVLWLWPISLETSIRVMHIPLLRGFNGDWVFYFSACMFCTAGFLQFPFREDEAWICACGYNLSYVATKSKKCPECGHQIQIEWTAVPGDLATKTKTRVKLTFILFIVTGLLFVIPTCKNFGKGTPRRNYIGLSSIVLSYTVNNFSLSKIISSRDKPTIS